MRFIVLCAALVLSTTAGCGKVPHPLYGERIAGQAVDADTGQPIPGVHVAFVWESGITPSGITGHNSRTICYHAAATTTDAQGRFEVESWRKWSTYNVRPVEPTALVYVRDYVPLQHPLFETGSTADPKEHPNERYALKRFSGTVDERLDVMWGGIANRGCTYGGESQKSLYPMQKVMYEEARSIALSPAQASRVKSFAWFAARAALAYDPNGPSHATEVDRFISENLK